MKLLVQTRASDKYSAFTNQKIDCATFDEFLSNKGLETVVRELAA